MYEHGVNASERSVNSEKRGGGWAVSPLGQRPQRSSSQPLDRTAKPNTRFCLPLLPVP